MSLRRIVWSLLVTALVVAAVVMLSGCEDLFQETTGEDTGSNGGADGSYSNNPWTDGVDYSGIGISMAGRWPDDLIEDAIDEFESETGMTVHYEFTNQGEIRSSLEGPDAPDLVILPQPGLGAALYDDELLVDVSGALGDDWLERTPDSWRSLLTEDNGEFGVWLTAAVKSLVWYAKPAFDSAGYEEPQTWAELQSLVTTMVADGHVAWSVGIESGGGTGWPATDWIEDIVLREEGPSVLDDWVEGNLAFNSTEIRNAFIKLDELWFGAEDYVLQDRAGIVSTSMMGPALAPLFDDPPGALMHRQASFAVDWFPEGSEIGTDIDYFILPPAGSAGELDSILVSGEFIAASNTDPATMAVMRYFTESEALQTIVEATSHLTPSTEVQPGDYPDQWREELADVLHDPDTEWRFDSSDLMPPHVGLGVYFTEVTEWIAGNQDLTTTLDNIDAAW